MRAAIVGRYNFAIERDLLRLPAHAEARFTRSVLLSRTAANCAFLPHIETVVYFRIAGFLRVTPVKGRGRHHGDRNGTLIGSDCRRVRERAPSASGRGRAE